MASNIPALRRTRADERLSISRELLRTKSNNRVFRPQIWWCSTAWFQYMLTTSPFGRAFLAMRGTTP